MPHHLRSPRSLWRSRKEKGLFLFLPLSSSHIIQINRLRKPESQAIPSGSRLARAPQFFVSYSLIAFCYLLQNYIHTYIKTKYVHTYTHCIINTSCTGYTLYVNATTLMNSLQVARGRDKRISWNCVGGVVSKN